MGTNNKNKKNKTGALLPLIVVAAAAIGALEENFSFDGRAVIIVVAAVFLLVLGVFGVYFVKTKLTQKSAAEYQFRHSHDRLRTSDVSGECSADQHWQLQLDGFLKAGIIDRNEYMALLKKHNEQAARSQR